MRTRPLSKGCGGGYDGGGGGGGYGSGSDSCRGSDGGGDKMMCG